MIHPILKARPTSDPNSYRTVMIGHTFSKLYITLLHAIISYELDQRHIWATRQVDFCLDFQIMNHIMTLNASMEEAQHYSLKVYSCFVNF